MFLNTYEKAGLPVDGVYSMADFEAVVKWQEKYSKEILAPWGLSKGTGYVFRTSLKKMNEIIGRECVASMTTTGTPQDEMSRSSAAATIAVKSITRNLKFGMTGTDVTILQQFLIREAKGPAAFALKNNGTSSYFGTLTKSALAEWQKANAVAPAIGFFGPLTRAFIAGV